MDRPNSREENPPIHRPTITTLLNSDIMEDLYDSETEISVKIQISFLKFLMIWEQMYLQQII